MATVVVQNVGGLSGIMKDVPPDERAAILKARFAETIAKAKAKAEKPSEGQKEDEERKKLARRQRLGEAKIKALLRKEEIKKSEELKRKRDQDREAARKALELLEKTVEVEDNFTVMKEFDMLIRGYTYDPQDGSWKKPKLGSSHSEY